MEISVKTGSSHHPGLMSFVLSHLCARSHVSSYTLYSRSEFKESQELVAPLSVPLPPPPGLAPNPLHCVTNPGKLSCMIQYTFISFWVFISVFFLLIIIVAVSTKSATSTLQQVFPGCCKYQL